MGNLIENRQIRVFISSTFQDMQDERDYLMKHTFPILRKLASERDVTLTELDLRWGITEEEAKSGKVVEICLREIENSIPFFIGIIGNRYGWVPEKKDIGENVTERFKDVNNYLERHLSVTEMEMQFGVLQRQEDMHAFFYIKEGEDKEDADNPEMLERLKKEVKASRYPSTTYSSPENLGIQVEQAFRTLLDRIFPEGHLSELEKERIGQRSFMNQLCQNYIRDDKNFQVLDKWMNDWNQHQMVVTGASGLGKSALIANCVREKLEDEKRDYQIIYHFTGNGGSESRHEPVRTRLIYEIRDLYGWQKQEKDLEQMEKDEDQELNDLFIKVASEGDKPLLIVLDAVNQIVDADNAKLLNWLPIPPKRIKILFSTLEDDRTMEVFQNRHYPIFTLQPLDIERRKELVEEYLHLYGKKLTDIQIERIATDNQCENTLVLKTLLDELINFGVYERLDERIDYYLSNDTIEEFYQALIQSQEDEFGKDFVERILSLIALSKNGLSEEEIIEISGAIRLHWSQFYHLLASHLHVRDGLVTFSHEHIRRAIINRYATDKESGKFFRKEIINYFQNKDTARSYEELAFQYDKLNDNDSLYNLMLFIPVFAFFYNGHIHELAVYWRKLKSEDYAFEAIRDVLLSADREGKSHYHDVINFSRYYLSVYSFALLLCQDYEIFLKYIGEDNEKELAGLYNDIGLLHNNKGDYDIALEYYQKALEIYEKVFGTEHPDTAKSYNYIGLLYNNQGNYDKALEYYMKALEIREKLFGTGYFDTATSYNNIGELHAKRGDYDKALDYYHKALEIRMKVFGTEHPDTAQSYNNFGVLYMKKGDYDNALEYYMKALKIWDNVLGTDHPDTAISYNNFGVLYMKKGDYDKALEYFQKALEIRVKVLGTDHPDTTNSYNNIGVLYDDMGNYYKALEYFQKALEIRVKVFGTEHPDTAQSYNNIGMLYKNQGDYGKAIECCKKALEIYEKVFVTVHPDTATSYNNIGVLYDKLGDYDNALKYSMKALEIKEKVFGTYHPDTAITYNYIGQFHRKQGDNDNAMDYYKKALEIREKVLGTEHPATATSYNDIGLLYSDNGEYDNALEYYMNALKIWDNLHGSGHSSTAITYNNIGLLYHNKGDYDKAFEYYMKALEILEKVLGADHPTTANSYNNIGAIYMNKGAYDKALEYYMKALEIQEKVFGTEHPDTATSYNFIGLVYENKGDYGKALEFHMKAHAVREKVLGMEHLDTAHSYNNIGVVYFAKGDYDKALEYCLKDLAITEKVVGTEHPDTAGSYNNIGAVYSDMGDYDRSLEYYLKAVKIYESVFGENHSKTASSYNSIAWTLDLISRYEEALPWAEKATKVVSNNEEYIDTLATIYQDLGRYDEALEQFEFCLKLQKEQNDSEESIHETEEKIAALKDLMKS